MMSPFRPSVAKIENVLNHAKTSEPTWQYGCDFTPRDGFNLDQSRTWIGTGQAAWQRAVDAMNAWKIMPASMVELFGSGPIEMGRAVGVMFYGLGIYSLNPCRIIDVIESTHDNTTHYGFTYATLPGHVETGIERFRLTWNHETDQVWYEISAISRPHNPLVWLVYPYARYQQRTFRERSTEQMLQAVMQPETSVQRIESDPSPPVVPALNQ